jgi:hypothetical protein
MRFAVLMTVLVMSGVLALGSDFDVPDKPAFTAAEIAQFVREDNERKSPPPPPLHPPSPARASLHFLPVLAPADLDLERHVELHRASHLMANDGGIGFGGV